MKYLLAFALILFSLNLFAQKNLRTTDSDRLSFAYGKGYNLKIDKTYSRLPKNGFNHFFNIEYNSINTRRIFEVQSNFMLGNLTTKGNTINILDDYVGRLKVGYLKNTKKLNTSNISIYIGGNLDFRADIWFPQKAQLRYGWDINLGIGISTIFLYKIHPKLHLQYEADISLLGVLWRSHNNGQQLTTEELQFENGIGSSAFETSRLSHPLNALYTDNSLRLFYRISKKIIVYYHFALAYKYLKKPLPKKGYEINNALGIAYKFKN